MVVKMEGGDLLVQIGRGGVSTLPSDLPPPTPLDNDTAPPSPSFAEATDPTKLIYGDYVEVDYWAEGDYHIRGFFARKDDQGSYVCIQHDGTEISVKEKQLIRLLVEQGGALGGGGGGGEGQGGAAGAGALRAACGRGDGVLAGYLLAKGAAAAAADRNGRTAADWARCHGHWALAGHPFLAPPAPSRRRPPGPRRRRRRRPEEEEEEEPGGPPPPTPPPRGGGRGARAAAAGSVRGGPPGEARRGRASSKSVAITEELDKSWGAQTISVRTRARPFLVGDRVCFSLDGTEWEPGFIKDSITLTNEDAESESQVTYTVVSDAGKLYANALAPSQLRCEPMTGKCFLTAAAVGAVETIRLWSLSGGSVDFRGPNGWTALHHACDCDQVAAAECLVEALGAACGGLDFAGAWARSHGAPFDRAFLRGHVRVAAYALRRRAAQSMGLSGRSAFSVSQSLVLSDYIRTLKQYLECIDLKNINLLTVKDFLRAGRFLHYDECISGNILTNGRSISATSSILFISHRWESESNPDPSGIQFLIAKEFIQKHQQLAGNFHFVWLDYSCISQNLNSTQFNENLMNIPTSIFASSHCLVIPRLVEVPKGIGAAFGAGGGGGGGGPAAAAAAALLGRRLPGGAPVTDLQDYLSRGWCQFEALACMITGCEVHCFFQLGSMLKDYVRITGDWYEPEDGTSGEEATSSSGFKGAALKALRSCCSLETKDKRTLWDYFLADFWFFGASEPMENISAAVGCILSLIQNDNSMFGKILNMSLTEDDLNQEGPPGQVFNIPLPPRSTSSRSFTATRRSATGGGDRSGSTAATLRSSSTSEGGNGPAADGGPSTQSLAHGHSQERSQPSGIGSCMSDDAARPPAAGGLRPPRRPQDHSGGAVRRPSGGGAGGRHPSSGRLSGVRVSYSLATVARDLGQLRKEGDRLLILRLLLFTLSYCMDKIPAAGRGGGLPFSSLAEGENPGLYPARLRKVSDNMVQLPELSTGDSSYPSMSGCGGGGGGSSRSSLKNGSGPVQSSRQGSLVDTLGHQAPKAPNRKSNGENHNREIANCLTHAQNDGCKATMQTYHSHESSLSMTQVEEIVEGYLPASPPIQSKDQSSDSATSSFGIQRQQYHTHHPQTDATNNMKNHGNGVFWGIHKHPLRSSQEDCGAGELGEQSNAAQQKIAQSFLRQQSSSSEDKEKEQEGEDKEGEGALLTDGEAHHNQHQHFCSSVPPHDNTSNRVIIRKRFSLQELSRQRLKTAVDAATLMQTRAKSTVCLVS